MDGRVPDRYELAAFLIDYSRHRFAPLGIQDAIITYDNFDSFKPAGWQNSRSLLRNYGYENRPKIAWPQLVHDLTGCRVATHGETLRAGNYWGKRFDAPLRPDEFERADVDEGAGLRVRLGWRDILAWDFRQRTYVPIAKQSVWSVI